MSFVACVVPQVMLQILDGLGCGCIESKLAIAAIAGDANASFVACVVPEVMLRIAPESHMTEDEGPNVAQAVAKKMQRLFKLKDFFCGTSLRKVCFFVSLSNPTLRNSANPNKLVLTVAKVYAPFEGRQHARDPIIVVDRN